MITVSPHDHLHPRDGHGFVQVGCGQCIKGILQGASTAALCHLWDLPCPQGRSLEMKSLLLTVTLFVLVTVLRAQDDLPFLSEDKNVRQGVMVEGVGGMLDCCPVPEDWNQHL